MKLTIKTGLFSALTALGTVALLAPVNAAGFGDLDANTDGQLDLAELQTSFGENAEATLTAYDTDADGMISVQEAEAMAAQAGATAAPEEAAATAEAAATEIAPGTEAAADAAAAVEAPVTDAVTEGAADVENAAETIDDAIRSSTENTTEEMTN